MRTLTLLGAAALATRSAMGFVFQVDNTTINECGNVRFNWTEGTPPYTITAMTVFNVATNETVPDSVTMTSNIASWQWPTLPYKQGTQVVFIMSDATGFATGGASPLYTIGGKPGGTSQCDIVSEDPPWTFSMNPESGSLPQCGDLQFAWDHNTPQTPVTITGVIPSGQVFQWQSASGSVDDTWYKVNIRSGTQIIFAAWDAAGRAGGTSQLQSVTSGDDACIASDAPSSTPLDWPASTTGSPTGTNAPPTNTQSTTRKAGVVTVTAIQTSAPKGAAGLSAGTIAGIVVGVVVAVLILQALLVWFCCRNQVNNYMASRKMRRERGKPGDVDLYERSSIQQARGPGGLLNESVTSLPRTAQSHPEEDDQFTISPFMGGTSAGRPSTSTSDPFSSQRDTYLSDTSTATGFHGGNNLSRNASTAFTSAGYAAGAAAAAAPTGRAPARAPSVAASTLTQTRPYRNNNSSKQQLAAQNADEERNEALFAGQPPMDAPTGGFRRHEDAGRFDSDGEQVEDLPPTYNPQWGEQPR